MANYLSPSVNVVEESATSTVPALASTTCGTVGNFVWGPCNEITRITNDKELEQMFGKPTDDNFLSFFSAWNYLQYGSDLRLVRVVDESTAKNAGIEILEAGGSYNATNAKILNSDAVEEFAPSFGVDGKLQVFAKYVGTEGNKISVAVASYTDFDTANIVTGTTFKNNFEYGPASLDEFAIAVLYDDVIVEKYIVSFDTTSVDYEGSNRYAPVYINSRSQYILVFDDQSNADEVDSIEATNLSGGVAEAPTNTEILAGFDMFDNAEEVDVNMIIDGEYTNATVQQYIIDNILESRKDCIGYLTVQRSDVVGVANISTAVSNMITYKTTTLARSTTYAALYGNWKYQYDQYNDKYRWLPLSGDIAGLTATTHYNNDPWFAPMGYTNGLLKNVKKLAINPKRSYRDQLYTPNNINPVFRDADAGFIVIGQKTLVTTGSPFSRLDVRWLFVTIEKALAAASKYVIGQKNTDFTQRQFVGVVTPYLKDVQGREGIENFLVKCDSTVNTAVVKERNEFHCEFYIVPTQTAEMIVLKFVNVSGSVSFDEVIKKR